MDLFSLEVLDAASGDALLVHYGRGGRRLLIVDGGFGHTYANVLKPRLKALASDFRLANPAEDQFGDAAPLPVELVIVTHLDADHIAGIERLFIELKDAKENGTGPLLDVRRLWHNSFDDAVKAATDSDLDDIRPVGSMSQAQAASVHQARRVRDIARGVGLDGNPPFNGLVTGGVQVQLGEGVVATVLAPTQTLLETLRLEWEATPVRGESDASAAAYLDESVPNLSSIVTHLRSATGKTMLLTGDARGDHILAGIEAAGLADGSGNCRVDMLKVPHHGSERTLEKSFFERVSAAHYVISGNGSDDNPSASTLRWIEETQGTREYTVWLTYGHNADHIVEQANRADRNFTVVVRPLTTPSFTVDVGDSSA